MPCRSPMTRAPSILSPPTLCHPPSSLKTKLLLSPCAKVPWPEDTRIAQALPANATALLPQVRAASKNPFHVRCTHRTRPLASRVSCLDQVSVTVTGYRFSAQRSGSIDQLSLRTPLPFFHLSQTSHSPLISVFLLLLTYCSLSPSNALPPHQQLMRPLSRS